MVAPADQSVQQKQQQPSSNHPTPAVAAFEALGLCRQLAEAAAGLGWAAPTTIQAQAIPHVLAGRDVIGLAQTGSGKTGAFSLPILQALLDGTPSQPHPTSGGLFALILSPTRELALQIAEQVEALGRGAGAAGLRTAALVGGIDMMAQAVALGKRPHVVVGTPGRVVDHLSNTKGFSLRGVRYLVLDEADKLLDMDFEAELDAILKALPRGGGPGTAGGSGRPHTQLFSATMTSKVQKLQRACLVAPIKVEAAAAHTTVATLRQQYVFAPAKHKDVYLCFVLNELAGGAGSGGGGTGHAAGTMVFTRTCDATRRLAALLRALGFGAVPIHGQMSQPKRLGALNKFKSGERRILVATDVAARGLDIPSVDLVINYDVPANPKDYVHRVGRTARAGRSGRAITIVTQYDVEAFQRIEHVTTGGAGGEGEGEGDGAAGAESGGQGKKMEAFPAERDEVLLLLERVGEAGRLAALQLKEADAGDGGSGWKGKRRLGGSAGDGKQGKQPRQRR